METRERILKAARETFAEKGYGATSLDEIAQALGLTKGAIYHHFPSKRALLEALLEEGIARAEAALKSSAPLEERLLAYAQAWREGVELLTALISTRSARRSTDQLALEVAKAGLRRVLGLLSDFLEEHSPGRGRELAAVFFSIVHGAYVVSRQVSSYRLDEVLRTGIRVFVRGLEGCDEKAGGSASDPALRRRSEEP